MNRGASGRNGTVVLGASNYALTCRYKEKGLFIALTIMYDSHFEGIDEPANLDRLKSICSTAFTIVKAATVRIYTFWTARIL